MMGEDKYETWEEHYKEKHGIIIEAINALQPVRFLALVKSATIQDMAASRVQAQRCWP